MIAVGYKEDPTPFYGLMDVFCLPGLREGLPGVVLEAMASRTVVVASDATGSVDLVRPGATGFLAKRRSAASLAEALTAAVENDELSATYIENAFTMVSRQHETHLVQGRLLRFLSDELMPILHPRRESVASGESGEGGRFLTSTPRRAGRGHKLLRRLACQIYLALRGDGAR